MANLKVKSVNAYIKKEGEKQREFVVVELDNGETVYINTGLVVYAIKNAKEVKAKNKENK